mgnify:CR=1 FL=1
MTLYFFKMIVCSSAFYALYALLFQKEKMLVFNRCYLLCGLVISFFIPLITISVKTPAPQLLNNNNLPVMYAATDLQPLPQEAPGYLLYIAVAVFSAVSIALLIRFCFNLYKIGQRINENEAIYINGVRVVLLNTETVPHSFMEVIFLNKAEYEADRVEAEVLEHELAHIRQKHSWDVLLVELLQIFVWFNPMIYLYRRAVKINHELLADAAVVKYTGDVRSYQHVLLQRAVTQSPLVLVSSFNFHTTKKRLIMLQKPFNKRKATKLSLWVIPLVIMLTFSFCNRATKNDTPAETEGTADTQAITAQQHTALQDTGNSVPGKDSSRDVSPLPPPPKIEIKKFAPPKIIRDDPEGPGATVEELATYESIVKRMKAGENGYKTESSDFRDLQAIYKKMTIQQRRDASWLLPPPPPKSGVIKFTPPKIVKDGSDTVRFTPPLIVKDEEVQDIIKESPGNEGVDKSRGIVF